MAQYDYVETTDNLRCTASFDEYVFSTFEGLLNQWSKFLSSGYNLQVGQEVEVSATRSAQFEVGNGLLEELNLLTSGKASISGTIATTIPPIFTRGELDSHNATGMETHFTKEEGSVAHTRAECAIYKVKVNNWYHF